MFWILAALLTAVAIAAVVVPLFRKSGAAQSADSYDLSIYKSQFKEIDADLKRGLIQPSEAEAARAEVARRVLQAQSAIDKEQGTAQISEAHSLSGDRSDRSGMPDLRFVAAVAVLVIPLVSFSVYFLLGSPGAESQPLSVRLNKPPEEQSLTELIASAEMRLKQNPDDAEGWKKLAPIYLSMRRPDEAVTALRNVLRIEGESSATLADLGEAIVVQEGGVVTKDAYSAFRRANQLDPSQPKPRFFLAIALGQQNADEEAIKAWNALIADSAEDAPWVSFARSQLASLRKRSSASQTGDASGSGTASLSGEAGVSQQSELAGPSQEDVDAAAELSDEGRQEMVEGMVDRLSQRLDDEGGSAEEWVRLIRAEIVLNRPDRAAKTVSKAMDALQSDVDGLEKVEAAARSLGLSVTHESVTN